MPQNRVNGNITHVTLITINGVVKHLVTPLKVEVVVAGDKPIPIICI